MSQKDTFPLFFATADPSLLTAVVEAVSGQPAMSLQRVQYVTVVTPAGDVTAAILPAGDDIPFATDALVVSSALHVSDGAGLFSPLAATLMDGEAGPISGSPTAIPTYSLIAGVNPGEVSLRAAQVYSADGSNIGFTALGDDTGGLLAVAGIQYAHNGGGFESLKTPNLFAEADANTAATPIEVIAAPGVGSRIRLMGYRFHGGGTLGAAANVDAFLEESAAALPFSKLVPILTTFTSAESGHVPIANGFPLAEDTPLDVNLGTTLTAGAIRVTVEYLIEAVPI